MALKSCAGLAASGSRVPIVLMSGLDERVLSSASRLGQALDLHIAGAVAKPLSLGDLRTLFNSHRRESICAPPVDDAVAAESEAVPSGRTTRSTSGALVVHYQPQAWLSTSAVAGAEALVRWRHPELGLVSPATFLPRAEGSGFMRTLTKAVLRDALAQCRRWARGGYKVPVSVNLSPALLDDLSLPDEIERLTLDANVTPSDVTLEVTESVAVTRRQVAMDVLTRLRLKGFRLALDDFGVGFSSLVELQHMPFTELKIDKSFVFDVAGDASARAIVDAVIGLAHKLSLRIVAEGIENAATWALLRDAGCDVGQGYLLSPAVDAASFDAFLARHERETRPRMRVGARS